MAVYGTTSILGSYWTYGKLGWSESPFKNQTYAARPAPGPEVSPSSPPRTWPRRSRDYLTTQAGVRSLTSLRDGTGLLRSAHFTLGQSTMSAPTMYRTGEGAPTGVALHTPAIGPRQWRRAQMACLPRTRLGSEWQTAQQEWCPFLPPILRDPSLRQSPENQPVYYFTLLGQDTVPSGELTVCPLKQNHHFQ